MSWAKLYSDDYNDFPTLLCVQQIDALVAASSSLLGCQGLKRVLEVILTFGNYMNSGKRVAAYGFKIQSLDVVSYVLQSYIYMLEFNRWCIGG